MSKNRTTNKSIQQLETEIQKYIPFKKEEVQGLLKKYRLDEFIDTDDLHTLYVLVNYTVTDAESIKAIKDKEEKIIEDFKIIDKFISDLTASENVDINSINFAFTDKGKSANITLKSEYFIVPLIQTLSQLITTTPWPELSNRKAGNKKATWTEALDLIIQLHPIIKSWEALNNNQIYNFFYDFLELCGVDWNESSFKSSSKEDLRERKIDSIKHYVSKK